MACIEHYIKDAENIFDEIKLREIVAQSNAYVEYKAARTIQKWFRGYITRKHIKRLNDCAITIQKHWRGYVDRKIYYRLLQEAVHKMYWEHYNKMATKIQKVWRGHFVRARVFSYYKLKEYINGILQKNKQLLTLAKNYEEETQKAMQRKMQEECQEWLTYLSFKTHHLIRTHQIEGIYSKHGTLEYSRIEKQLKNLKFTDYMNSKHAKKTLIQLQQPEKDYIFKGRMRECEEAWIHRNDPGLLSLATGEYGLELKKQAEQKKIEETFLLLQNKPMKFGPVRYKDEETMLDMKKFHCPPLHRRIEQT